MHVLKISIKYAVGQFVYPRADPDQVPRIITGYTMRKDNRIFYLASNHDNERAYEEFELSDVKVFQP